MNCCIAEALDLDLKDLQQSKPNRDKKEEKRTESCSLHTEPIGQM